MIIGCGYVDTEKIEYFVFSLSTWEKELSYWFMNINKHVYSLLGSYQQKAGSVENMQWDNFRVWNRVEKSLIRMLQPCGYPMFMGIKRKVVENTWVIHNLFRSLSTRLSTLLTLQVLLYPFSNHRGCDVVEAGIVATAARFVAKDGAGTAR